MIVFRPESDRDYDKTPSITQRYFTSEYRASEKYAAKFRGTGYRNEIAIVSSSRVISAIAASDMCEIQSNRVKSNAYASVGLLKCKLQYTLNLHAHTYMCVA